MKGALPRPIVDLPSGSASRRARWRGLLALALGACVPDNAGSAPQAARSAAPSATATATATASAEPPSVDAGAATLVPAGAPRWRTPARAEGGFWGVLDGVCSQLGIGRVGKDVVVHYGGGSLEAGQREGMASFIALRDGLEAIGDPPIASPKGIAGSSLDDFWVADSTGTRTSEGAVLHRRLGASWKVYAKDQTNIHAWVDGGVIGTLGFAASNGDVWVEGSTTRPPPSFHANMPYPQLAAFPTGDVLIVGHRGMDVDTPLYARHWSPAKGKVSEYPLEAILGAKGWGAMVEVSPSEVYVVRDDRVARWDGGAWYALAKVPGGATIKVARRAAADDLWVLTEAGAVVRLTKTSAKTLPAPEPLTALSGVDAGAPWAVSRSGKLYRRASASVEAASPQDWSLTPLPAPTFSAGGALVKAKDVLVIAKDEVLVTAQYWEKGPGWKDQELHTTLLRTKAVNETLRCNEPDPENNNIHIGRGFQSWGAPITADCKTPFAVLARRSNARKSSDDWPRLRGAVKGHPELGELELREFVSGDRTFVGARVKDLDSGKKLLSLVTRRDRLRPELVCGDPAPTRRIAIDPRDGRRRALRRGWSAVLAIGAATAACAGARPGASPGTGASPGAAGLSGAAACATCHAAIADEWRSSLHRAAYTDATFQASLAMEDPADRAFCGGCHAPARRRAGVEAGVDCASCHGSDPHTKSVARGEARCAGCHEFTFEGRAELVQKTVSEHAASAFAGVACVDCHMPPRAGHRDHRFVGGHAPASFAPAVHVDARRAGGGVEIAIRVDAGHAFPTGDMFRRARLLVFAEDAHGQIVGEAERVFGRRWGSTANGARTEIADTRIRGSWNAELALDPPRAAAKIRWQLVYERVVAARGDSVSVVASDPIAEGELEAEGALAGGRDEDAARRHRHRCSCILPMLGGGR